MVLQTDIGNNNCADGNYLYGRLWAASRDMRDIQIALSVNGPPWADGPYNDSNMFICNFFIATDVVFENVSRETFLFFCAVCYNKIEHIFVRGDNMIGETGKIVALTNVRTPIEAEMLQDILQQEGIAVMVKEHGSGGYSKIYMGISLFGETLYVNDYDYPRAVELMNAMAQNGEQALDDVQAGAFDNADAFDAYEVAQIEAAAQNDTEPGMQKSKGAVILAIVLIVALILYGLK